MTDPIKPAPATDEEIAVVVDHLAKWIGPEILPNAITRNLLARIEADRATIAARDAEIERLSAKEGR